MKKNIAIIGSGFAGLSTCYHLLTHPNCNLKITLFDKKGIGAGASGIASGMMHPYPGAHAPLAWQAKKGMEASLHLFKIAEKYAKLPLFEQTGLLRVVSSEKQRKHFKKRAETSDDVSWVDDVTTYWKETPHSSGIFIHSAVSVFCSRYLDALWSCCSSLGAQFALRSICSLEELRDFDVIICTTGGQLSPLPELTHLPLNLVKGQLLSFPWERPLEELSPCPLSSSGYMTFDKNLHLIHVGSTYEREFDSELPDLAIALSIIYKKSEPFFPALSKITPSSVYAGIRAMPPGRVIPLMGKLNAKSWIFLGLGSKGLLHHAHLSKQLAQAIYFNDETKLPQETLRWKENSN